MSSKKKMKPSQPSSVTLHSFFSPKTATTTPKQTPTQQKGNAKDIPTVRKTRIPTQEVIIIDSDSDDDTRAGRSKRRKLTSTDKPASTKAFRSIKPGKQGPEDSSSHNTRSARTLASEADTLERRQTQRYSFGEPLLLTPNRNHLNIHLYQSPPPNECSDPPSGTLASPSEFPDPPNTISWGKPTLLSPSTSNTANMVLPPIILTKKLEEVDIDLTVDYKDDWEMGDDELASIIEVGEHDVIDVEYEETATYISTTMSSRSHKGECLGLQHQPPRDPLSPLASVPPPSPPIDTNTKLGSTNAFSKLMGSFKENEAWKEASTFEDKNPRPMKGNGGRRKAPFYKVMDGMPIAVDAFCYGTIPGVTAYFLTHAHSDHYTRLSSAWKSGPIYCSQETANLIIHILLVDKKWVYPIPMDVPTVIPDTGGVSVTLIEANHCPGSCLFLFEGRQTVHAGDSNYKPSSIGSSNLFRYLHCGDFRASPRHVLHPAVKGKRIDHVYLDTTYLDPKYTFPPQPLVISACAEVAKRLVLGQSSTDNKSTMDAWVNTQAKFGKQKDKEDSFLVIVGTYSIGKERIVKAIAHALNTKVFCDTRKAAILKCEADAELDGLLTLDPLEAMVHLVPLGSVNAEQLQTYAGRFKGKYTKVIAFRPTGWTFTPGAGMNQSPTVSSILSRSQQKDFTHADLQPARSSTSALQVFPVPYSEHSSFYELTCFAMSFNWGKMIATVNVGSETSRNKMAKWFRKWQDERKKRGTDTIIDHRHADYW